MRIRYRASVSPDQSTEVGRGFFTAHRSCGPGISNDAEVYGRKRGDIDRFVSMNLLTIDHARIRKADILDNATGSKFCEQTAQPFAVDQCYAATRPVRNCVPKSFETSGIYFVDGIRSALAGVVVVRQCEIACRDGGDVAGQRLKVADQRVVRVVDRELARQVCEGDASLFAAVLAFCEQPGDVIGGAVGRERAGSAASVGYPVERCPHFTLGFRFALPCCGPYDPFRSPA